MKLLMDIDPGVRVIMPYGLLCKRYKDIVVDFDKAYVDKYTGIDISSDMIEET